MKSISSNFLFVCLAFTLSCGHAQNSKLLEANVTSQKYEFFSVADTPVQVILRTDILDHNYGDDTLAAIESINSSLPMDERIKVLLSYNDGPSLLDRVKAAEDELATETDPADIAMSKKALKFLSAPVRFFKDLGYTPRLHPEEIPSLPNTQVDIRPVQKLDTWLQDYGEYALQADGQSVFVYTGKGELDSKGLAELATAVGTDVVKASGTDTQGSFGGNIEKLPNGILMVGEHIEPALLNELQNGLLNPEILQLHDLGLEAQHLDEQISAVTTNDACGFALLKGDPRLGLTLAESITQDEFDSVPKQFQSIGGFRPGTVNNGYVDGVDLSRSRLDKQNHEKLALAIDANVQKIVEASQILNPACVSLKVVSVPLSVFGCDNDSAGNPVGCHVAVGNQVNAVSLGQHVLVGDPMLPSYRKSVIEAYASLGVTTHFVDATSLKAGKGGLHCASNVLRKKK